LYSNKNVNDQRLNQLYGRETGNTLFSLCIYPYIPCW